jgi:hypothetical protein
MEFMEPAKRFMHLYLPRSVQGSSFMAAIDEWLNLLRNTRILYVA